MAKLLNVLRARIPDTVGNQAGPTGKLINAQYLVASIDMDEDGRRVETARFEEVDHVGLMAEWTAGVATTILDAALVAWLAGRADTERLSATQKTYIKTPVIKAWP